MRCFFERVTEAPQNCLWANKKFIQKRKGIWSLSMKTVCYFHEVKSWEIVEWKSPHFCKIESWNLATRRAFNDIHEIFMDFIDIIQRVVMQNSKRNVFLERKLICRLLQGHLRVLFALSVSNLKLNKYLCWVHQCMETNFIVIESRITILMCIVLWWWKRMTILFVHV
jgi:hypothetical protein